jgi:hypothetical protein
MTGEDVGGSRVAAVSVFSAAVDTVAWFRDEGGVEDGADADGGVGGDGTSECATGMSCT